MRIAYLTIWAEQAHSGVISKIRAQTAFWRAQGHKVAVFLLVPEWNCAEIEEEFRNDLDFRAFGYRSRAGRQLRTAAAVRAAIHWEPDLVYGRQMIYHPAFSYLGARLPIVVEVNTNDLRELEAGSQLRRWYNRGTRPLSYALCRGLVCVTRELADAPEFAGFGKPTTVISNGIDLGSVEPLPPADNDAPTLVFLGSSGQRWHGVDKIASLAQQLPEYRFHLVGPEPEDLGVVPGSNVFLHGYLDEVGCRAVLAQADVAIGTLALHRKGMEEACPLKVREYLASGLPTIIAYRDTDFPDDVPFILRLPNVEQNLDALVIEGFVQSWYGKRVERRDVMHLDITAKEESRLTFLESCAR